MTLESIMRGIAGTTAFFAILGNTAYNAVNPILNMYYNYNLPASHYGPNLGGLVAGYIGTVATWFVLDLVLHKVFKPDPEKYIPNISSASGSLKERKEILPPGQGWGYMPPDKIKEIQDHYKQGE
jgi:hypothetical protein